MRALAAAMGLALIAPCAAAVPVARAPSVEAGQVVQPDLRVVDQLVLERAARLAASRRGSDDREAGLLQRLADRRRQITTELAALTATKSRAARLRGELAKITEEGRRLATAVGRGDPDYDTQLADFTARITALAQSPDPRRRSALQAYGAGQRAQAVADLVGILERESKAAAEGWRQVGALAIDMFDRGEKPPKEVIRIYETAQRLDPKDHWSWVLLTRLYREVGDSRNEQRAARRVAQTAVDVKDDSTALAEAGDAALSRGDLAAASAAYGRAVNLVRGILKAQPQNGIAMANLAIALRKYGDTERHRGNMRAAAPALAESVQLFRGVSLANPGNADIDRNFASALAAMADLVSLTANPQGARPYYAEAVEISRRLAAKAPRSVPYQSNLAETLDRLGAFDLKMRDLRRATAEMSQAVAIDRANARALQADPMAAQAAAMRLVNYAALSTLTENFARSRQDFAEALAILERLAREHPGANVFRDTYRGALGIYESAQQVWAAAPSRLR